MVASIVSSLPSFGWAFLLLTLMLYLYSLLILQGVEGHFRTHGLQQPLLDMYGGLGPSMLSLFMSISGGMDWADCLAPLWNVDVIYLPLFVVFITFVVFGVLNILTAVFIEASSRIIEVDRDLVVQQNLADDKSTINHLKRLFEEADMEGTGRLTRAMCEEAFEAEHAQAKALLKALGLDICQARSLFQLLDMDRSGEVDLNEFVNGFMRLRGAAKGVDVATVMYENKRLFHRLKDFMKEMDRNFKRLSTNVEAIQEDVDMNRQQSQVIRDLIWSSSQIAARGEDDDICNHL